MRGFPSSPEPLSPSVYVSALPRGPTEATRWRSARSKVSHEQLPATILLMALLIVARVTVEAGRETNATIRTVS
jgi:hypothetical protein